MSGGRSGARRLALSALISLALHGLPVLLLIAPPLRLPAPPIPIEVRSSRRSATVRRASEPTRGDPRAQPPPSQPAGGVAKVHKRGPGRKKSPPAPPAPPAPPPPPATADLGAFAPGDARIVVLLRTDRLRASPHRVPVEALLEAFPDYATLFGGSALAPLADLDALLIATPNFFDVTATFLAARHAADGRVRNVLEHRALPPWEPRRFRFVEPTLSVLTRARIDIPGDVRAPPVPDGGAPPTVVDEKVLEARWLNSLRTFERLADVPGAPAVLVTVEDLDALIRLQGGLPTPLTLALAATADAAPSVRVRATFADVAEATWFAAAWPSIVQRWRGNTRLLGLGSALDGLTLKQDGVTLELTGILPAPDVRLALTFARMFLPQRAPPVAAAPPGESLPVPIVPPSGPSDGTVAAPPDGSAATQQTVHLPDAGLQRGSDGGVPAITRP